MKRVRQNIADAVGLAAAIDYLNRIGFDSILRYEQELVDYAYSALESMPGIRLIGQAKKSRGGAIVCD